MGGQSKRVRRPLESLPQSKLRRTERQHKPDQKVQRPGHCRRKQAKLRSAVRGSKPKRRSHDPKQLDIADEQKPLLHRAVSPPLAPRSLAPEKNGTERGPQQTIM